MISTTSYIGRFAPSPSGDLHFGSLIAALGSYLQAKAHQGKWLVRIEDIDPPREVKGSAQRILHALECYGLHWDGEILYQSSRTERYHEVLNWLHRQQKSYYCHCNRSRIQTLGGYYDNHCRDLNLLAEQAATRIYQTHPVYSFHDHLHGILTVDSKLAEEDFIIHRKDGLFAYNLAVVIDDHDQGVTEIVRGADLIEPTARQISLYHHLDWQSPEYLHLPLIVNCDGNKLSKQNHAPALSLDNPLLTLAKALYYLGQPLPDSWQDATIEALLDWAVIHWNVQKIPKQSITNNEFLF